MASWNPSKRPPMLGNEVLLRSKRKLQPMVETPQGLRRKGRLVLQEAENPVAS